MASQAEPETVASLILAIALHPNDAKAIAHRGETYRLMGRYEEALADFERAIALKPEYAWAIAYRCQLYALMNRYEETLIDFDRAIAFDKTIIFSWQGARTAPQLSGAIC